MNDDGVEEQCGDTTRERSYKEGQGMSTCGRSEAREVPTGGQTLHAGMKGSQHTLRTFLARRRDRNQAIREAQKKNVVLEHTAQPLPGGVI